MDERHLLAAVRYIELNPVRARLCEAPEQWRWSSARAHSMNVDDDLVVVGPMRSMVDNWGAYLSAGCDADETELIRKHTRTGRPLGSEAFIDTLERTTGRRLRKRKAGRPPKCSKTDDATSK